MIRLDHVVNIVNCQAQGSRWYFPQAYRLSEHGK
jgi:hypothetical protein